MCYFLLQGRQVNQTYDHTNLDIVAYPCCATTVQYLCTAFLEAGFCESFRIDILEKIFEEFWTSKFTTQQCIVTVLNRIAATEEYQKLITLKRPNSRTFALYVLARAVEFDASRLPSDAVVTSAYHYVTRVPCWDIAKPWSGGARDFGMCMPCDWHNNGEKDPWGTAFSFG